MIRINKKILTVLLVLSLSNTIHAGTIDNRQVEYGISALKKGDYQTALDWLNSAKTMQSNHPDLYNALGLSYFQLKNYQQAEHYFLLARGTERKHEAAFFLGRISEINSNLKQAEYWYQLAADQYDDTEIQAEADQSLLNLSLFGNATSKNLEPADQLRSFVFIAVDASQVDGIVNPDDSSGENDNDASVSMLAAGSTTLSPINSTVDWKLGGNLYLEKYQDFSIYDVQSYGAYSSFGYQFGQHQLLSKFAYSHFDLDSEPYLDQIEISVKDTFPLDNLTKLVLLARYFDVSSPEETYDYYAGSLAELGAEIRGGKSLKWRLGAAYRTENRADLESIVTNIDGETLNTFTSYSRDWLRLRGKLSWNWSKRWQQKLEASWRKANYQNADTFLANTSDNNLSSVLRTTDRVGLKAELTHMVTNKLDINTRWQYLQDDSNNDTYDFDSQSISLGISYLF